MKEIPADELDALIDVLDLVLQQAEDVNEAIVSDKWITDMETMLRLTADQHDYIKRLQRCKQRLEEERARRAGETAA